MQVDTKKSVISNIMIVGDLIFDFAVKLSWLIKFSNQKFRKKSLSVLYQ
jgi:hypothetical protein